MKLTFLGTRGYIEPRTRRHSRHTSMRVAYRGGEAVIDCGETWQNELEAMRPRAILITHPHPDHAFGLQDGAPCPVYAIEEAWAKMDAFAIPARRRRTLTLRRPARVQGILFEPFPVVHSTRAPAVGYRITAGRVSIFYVPDVVWIHDREEALAGIRVYIGDGASLERNMVRKEKHTGKLVGHTPVRSQLTWCRKEGVPRMIVTHCGAGIVGGDERKVKARLSALARERGVQAQIAHDGMELVLR